jgi:hypothetical protein
MGPLCPALAGGAPSGGLLGGWLGGVLALAHLRRHRPRQEFVKAVAGMVGNAIEHVAQVGLRVDAAQLGGADQGVDDRRAATAGIGAEVQEVLSSDRNRRVILPMSGRKLKSFTAGIPCTAVASGASTATCDSLFMVCTISVSVWPPHLDGDW